MGVGYSQFPSKMLNLQLLCFSSVNAMCSQEKLLQSLNLGVFPVHPHTQHCLLMLGADASATHGCSSIQGKNRRGSSLFAIAELAMCIINKCHKIKNKTKQKQRCKKGHVESDQCSTYLDSSTQKAEERHW